MLTFFSHSSIRQGHATEDIKNAMLQKRAGIEDAVAVADEDLAGVQAALSQLQLAISSTETAEQAVELERQADENALKQLEGERIALQATRKILEELLPKTEENTVNGAASQPQRGVQVTFGNIHLTPGSAEVICDFIVSDFVQHVLKHHSGLHQPSPFVLTLTSSGVEPYWKIFTQSVQLRDPGLPSSAWVVSGYV
jgi:hypothetical protein